MTKAAIQTTAGFVDQSHPAFFLHFEPREAPRAHILYLPPFAEEMNRCRSLVAEQARRFARKGFSVAILDFYGTGESAGHLADANLEIWRNNIAQLMELLLERHQQSVYLWGCRLGALLAMDFLRVKPGTTRKLLLWQPVASGSAFVTQLLRQRTASLMKNSERAETTADMKLRLAAGQTLDVAGYRLGGELMTALDQLEMTSLFDGADPAHAPAIFWLEHTPDPASGIGSRSARALAHLERSGAQVASHTFTGDPVWLLHKRGNCDDLLAKTEEIAL
ncbi:MAG: hydrolase 2, exosortase A system-associated [Porticoccaceae bacterium]